jgi:hypothetical protein
VTAETSSIGEALDQLAREILRHLAQHRLTVVWLFDESISMRDDQQALKEKFDRVAGGLRLGLDERRGGTAALQHVVAGFGREVHLETPRPTAEIGRVLRAIDGLPVDESGLENTMAALQRVILEGGKWTDDDRRMLVVLVTDESGDDGELLEETRRLAVSRKVPVYVIGRQAIFGYDRVHMRYEDPVTGDVYWPAIRRGPESAAPETLLWDGLHERRDEQASGFAPYELARLVRSTGGIYFLLPTEENMRVRRREKAYSMRTLQEYVPDTRSRPAYLDDRGRSPLRTALAGAVEATRGAGFRRHFPVDPAELERALLEAAPPAQQRLKLLFELEARLRALAPARDREPERRWQAHYDLMLAQVVTHQVKAYEYLACLDEMVELARAGRLVPSRAPVPGRLVVEWLLNHAPRLKAPPEETAKKVAEATSLLQAVIARHPGTPWADLAQDELDRGFGVGRTEWHHDPRYTERERLVPSY